MTVAYVGLGSNEGDSPGNLREALARLAAAARLVRNSDFYVTKAWGRTAQPDFCNAAAALETDLSAPQLLARLIEIEAELGRQRRERWGPRTIDLDLLLFGGQVIDDPRCAVPHPRLRERAFALLPLAEIAPGTRVPPDHPTVAELAGALPGQETAGVRRLPNTAVLSPPPRLDYDAAAGLAADYDKLRPFSAFNRAVFEAVALAIGLRPGMRVLDVGCGTGRFTERLARAGADATGLDRSASMLAAAGRSAQPESGARYVRGDAQAAYPGAPYDAVTAFFCVHYFSLERFAARARDALVPGGALAIATFPHRHFAELEDFGRFFPSLPAIDMARFPSVPRVAAALREAGYAEVLAHDLATDADEDASALIERVEHKYLSTFHLLDPAEFAEGVRRMRQAWRHDVRIRRRLRAAVVSGKARPSASPNQST